MPPILSSKSSLKIQSWKNRCKPKRIARFTAVPKRYTYRRREVYSDEKSSNDTLSFRRYGVSFGCTTKLSGL